MNGKIWVLGDAVVDLLPDGEGRLLQCPGGAPANVVSTPLARVVPIAARERASRP